MFEKERAEIDHIDQQLVQLLLQRFEVTQRIGNKKRELQLPVKDEKREQQIIHRLCQQVPDEQKPWIADIYHGIMDASCQQQEQLGNPCVLKVHEIKRYRHFGLMFMKRDITGKCVDGWFVQGHNETLAGVIEPVDEMYVASGIRSGRTNIAPYEFLTWLLDQFTSVDQVLKELYRIHLVLTHATAFPYPKMDWLIADATQGVRLYSTPEGIVSQACSLEEIKPYFQ